MGLKGRLILSFLLQVLLFFSLSDSSNETDTVEIEGVPFAPFLNRTDETSEFLLRKCCETGQVYATRVNGSNQHCVNYGTPSHRESTLIEVSQELFFTHQNRSIAEVSKFKIDSGFPRDCNPGGSIILEPDSSPADRFYPLESGHLVVPHRFWFFQPDHHCMEDFFLDNNFNNVRRSAIICIEQIKPFPATAVDHRGRLNFDFLPGVEASSALTKLSGRKVIRKCCDINQVYSLSNHSCIPKQGYATTYFDDLQNQEMNGEELFFHVGPRLNCLDELETTIFTFSPDSGRLRIKMEETDENWQEVITYCLDDFVIFFEDELPETINVARFCPPQFPDLIPSVDSNDQGLSVPRCCPTGYVVDGHQCQPLNLGEKANKITESVLLRALQTFSDVDVSAGILAPNVTLSCGLSTSYPLHSANNLTLATPSFKNDENNSLVFALHYFVDQYWDFNVTLKPFCLDLQLFRTAEDVSYEPTVWFCPSPSHVSGHYPVLLYISSVALVATFVIYFFIPASGAARLVIAGGGGRKQMGQKKRPITMAMMLTGRNLLSHIACLTVTFIALAIGQQEYIVPGEGACTTLGYVIYGASIASFSWLTVFCFDYCWMFRGSFNVSDTFIFIPYSFFGWGVPILTLSVATVAQFGNRLAYFLPDVNPNMGLVRCWFAGETSALVFFYIPVCFLLSLNIGFFVHLLFNPKLMNCAKKKNKSGPELRINRKGSKASEKQEDVNKAIKLFFIAGTPWIFEIFAWLPSYFKTGISLQWRQNTVYLFALSNTLNALRGVVVFILFVVLQRDVRRNLWLRLKHFWSGPPESQPASGSGAPTKSQPRSQETSSNSGVSASSDGTLESNLSPAITASTNVTNPFHFNPGQAEPVVSSPLPIEEDEITYL